MSTRAAERQHRTSISRFVLCILTAIAMIATGGVVAAVHAPTAQAADTPQVLTCGTGVVYGVSQSSTTDNSGNSTNTYGHLVQYIPSGSNANAQQIGTGWTGLSGGSQPNGLGIAAGGSAVYAYSRSNSSNLGYDAQIISYVPSTGTWTTSGLPYIDTSQKTAPGGQKNVNFVTGAVNLATGDYMLSGFDSSGNADIYKWTPGTSSIVYVGTFPTGINGAINGDIAFDKAGNLYVLGSVALNKNGQPTNGSTGPGGNGPITKASMNIFVVTAANLTKALGNPGKTIPASNPTTKTITSTSGFNGISFDGDGSVWVSSSSQILNFNASNWVQNGTAKNITSSNTDLASCSSPATLTIQKNVVGRADASDQFTLSVTNSGTAIQPATTTGSDTGIQADQIGPTLVVTNTTYNFAEAMASGSASAMSAYTTTWQCTAPSPYNVNVSGTGTSGSVTVPATIDPTGAAITCAFTNTPKPGGVEWAKEDSSSGAVLGGSEWKITGPSPSTQNLAVTDCVGSSAAACAGTNDINFVAGEFEVQGLAPGDYTLTETKAPAGYALDPNAKPFTVTSGTTKDLQVIQNTKLPAATVTISKTVQDVNGQNGRPVAGWSMSSALTSNPPSGQNPAGVAVAPAGAQTTAGANGVTPPWTVTYPSATAQASVTVAETQQTGYQFVSGSCTVTPTTGSTRTVSLAGATGNVVSGINPGDAVACSFINKQQPGSVTWEKVVDGDTSTHLAGSTWTLTGPGVPANTVVNDCTISGSCGSGAYTDQDARPGYFQLQNLAWGSYTLTESKAPAGYVLSTASYPFTISASGLTATINGGSPIANKQQTPPVLPFTGGMSTDEFLIGGTCLMLLSLGLAFVWRRKRASSM